MIFAHAFTILISTVSIGTTATGLDWVALKYTQNVVTYRDKEMRSLQDLLIHTSFYILFSFVDCKLVNYLVVIQLEMVRLEM